MKIVQIRQGVFETNSSSTHSMTITTKEEWLKFKNGELYFNEWEDELTENELDSDKENNQSFNEWEGDEYLETYVTEHTTKSGDEIVIFGKYGRDG